MSRQPMPLRLVNEPPQHDRADGPEGQTVRAWLDELVERAALGPDRARDLRDELDAHLSERIVSLTHAGWSVETATNKALSELGDQAELARQFREIERTDKRRRLMRTGLWAACGGAAVLGLGTLIAGGEGLSNTPQPTGVRIYTPASGVWTAPQTAQANQVEQAVMRLALEAVPLGEALHRIAREHNLQVFPRVLDLSEHMINLDAPISLAAPGLTLAEVFTLLNESIGLADGETLAYRIRTEALEVATRAYFDRRESRLAAYDVRSILDMNTSDDLLQLLTTIVSPNDWVDQGGDLANAMILDGKLFVHAPPRMHEQVAWILEQLVGETREGGSAAAGFSAPGR
ncbi:MAG: hypothetical protein KIT24_07620 [Phycisphaeraceae bacterium]|nr:hypothetical protein [Phycisphaeraceae bacterium]